MDHITVKAVKRDDGVEMVVGLAERDGSCGVKIEDYEVLDLSRKM